MSRVLVLSPHPDDEAIGCGGTLLLHGEKGDEVRVVFLTSGEKGGHGSSEEETMRKREKEASDAAKILGIDSFEFWRNPDGGLRATPSATDRLNKLLKSYRPHTIYLPHNKEMHPDHRATVRLLRRSLTAATERMPDVLMFEVWTPTQQLDEIVDISPYMETKLRAIRAYRTQCAVMGFVPAVRGLNRYRGEMHSWPGGDYAEVFTRMRG